MCGITGYFLDYHAGANRISISVREEVTRESTNLLSHRGPDGSGIFFDHSSGVGLGHTRLAIIDKTKSALQPMKSASGECIITFNGEIYNFQTLRNSIAKRDCMKWRSNSDTEVLLELLSQGPHDVSGYRSALNHIDGIFSFALWNAKAEKGLVVRDPFGVKPLYYSEIDEGIFFSSEIKSLVHLVDGLRGNLARFDVGRKHWDLDSQSLNRYLTFLWCPGPGTPLQSIKMLEPGNAILVERGRVSEKFEYYSQVRKKSIDLDLGEPCRRPQKTRKVSDVCSELVDKLRTAVHSQLVSDVPVGAFLSGGLDSSAVVALASEQLPEIDCFTISVPELEAEGFVSDLPYAHQVANHLKKPLHVVEIDANHIAQNLSFMIHHLEEPIPDLSALNVFYISQLARKQGIKVMLSGCGGDDVFTGYRRHQALELYKFFSWIPNAVKSSAHDFFKRLNQNRTFVRRATKFLGSTDENENTLLINHLRWAGRKDLHDLYTARFKESCSQTLEEQPLIEFLDSFDGDVSRIEKALLLERRFFLSDHNLLYTDKMSMATGVEVRVPFLDRNLVEFASTLPDNYKIRFGCAKWIFKKSMESFLPKNVIYRPKTGFGVPLRRWMRREFRDLMAELLSRKSLESRGIFASESVQKLVNENDRGVSDWSYTLFSLMCIEIWCRIFLDKNNNAV